MYDIAIIGAGPAGSTLARLLGKTHKVLLVDERQLKDPSVTGLKKKCCGGLLAPDAQAMLSRFGLGLPKSILVDPQLFVVRTIDIPQRLERYYQRYYINMDREKFDAWLVSLIPPGVDMRPGSHFVSYERKSGCFNLRLRRNGSFFSEKAGILVGADGAFSRVRRQSCPGAQFRQMYFGMQEWAEAGDQHPYFSAIFDPEITDYYCWTIPKENFLIIGAALLPQEQTSLKFERLKKKIKDYGIGFGKTVRREGAYILRSVTAGRPSACTKGIALIGEAGGWISPSSSEGLSYAFRSALELAEVLRASSGDFEERFYARSRELRRNIFLKNLKSRFIFHPFIRKFIMKTGLQSLDVFKA